MYQFNQVEEPNVIANETDEEEYVYQEPAEDEEMKEGELKQVRQLMEEQRKVRLQELSNKKRR